MAYSFTLTTERVGIDPDASYGYWERKDGSEGGGLWFEQKTLVDFDGATVLPAAVVTQIESLGYFVGPEYRA